MSATETVQLQPACDALIRCTAWLESNPEGVYLYDGNWVAEKKVNGKSIRRHFSVKKHGQDARQMAIDARAKLVSKQQNK